jgi:hypothetical protein
MKKLVVVLIAFSLLACHKVKNTPIPSSYNLYSMDSCYKKTTWTKSLIFSTLMGSWQMNQKFGGWTGNVPPDNVLLKFTADSLLTVYKDGKFLSSNKFYLGRNYIDSNYYSVKPDTASGYAFGRIIFCGNEVVFSDDIVDGIDYYYARVSK